jgi:F-type H+-transporting ATPase subunit beta
LFSTEKFSDILGRFVSLDDTVKGFSQILSGAYDEVPEQAFYMVGTIEEALEKAKTRA